MFVVQFKFGFFDQYDNEIPRSEFHDHYSLSGTHIEAFNEEEGISFFISLYWIDPSNQYILYNFLYYQYVVQSIILNFYNNMGTLIHTVSHTFISEHLPPSYLYSELHTETYQIPMNRESVVYSFLMFEHIVDSCDLW